MRSRSTLISILVLSAVTGVLPAFAAERTIKDCNVCPEMVVVPAGSFVLGRNDGRKSEAPARRLTLKSPFALSRTEVTYAQWDACVAEKGCRTLDKEREWGRGQRPVIYVKWQDAVDYTNWLSRKTGQTYRLPIEEEWEYAARGGRPLPPNGAGIANCHRCGGKAEHKTLPVAQFPPNGYGLYDMLGNVMEWTLSCWRADHAAKERDCSRRVRRGGSWYYNRMVSTPTSRTAGRIDHFGYDIGFRVLRQIKE
jgi:formylglycine-generating enzyme required for sulfatase activity